MFKYFSAAAASLALVACNPIAQADGADELSAQFHADFSDGNFEKIWSDASDEFRAATPRGDFDREMARLREFYGEYQGGTREGINLNTNNGVTTTEITMHTTYFNSRATEDFTFIGTGDDMALMHWNISAGIAEDEGNDDADADDEAAAADAAADANANTGAATGKPGAEKPVG